MIEACETNIVALDSTKDFKCSLVSDTQQSLRLADLTTQIEGVRSSSVIISQSDFVGLNKDVTYH